MAREARRSSNPSISRNLRITFRPFGNLQLQRSRRITPGERRWAGLERA